MTDGLATNHVDQVLGRSVSPRTTERLSMMNAKAKPAIFSRFILGAIDPTRVDESDIVWGGEGHKVQVRHLAACGDGWLMIQCNVTITEVTDETVKRETHVDWVMGWGLMPYGNFDIFKIVCRNNTLLE
jgi:hypothetical protein